MARIVPGAAVVRIRGQSLEGVVAQDKEAESLIMFDPDHSWDERILAEQFKY